MARQTTYRYIVQGNGHKMAMQRNLTIANFLHGHQRRKQPTSRWNGFYDKEASGVIFSTTHFTEMCITVEENTLSGAKKKKKMFHFLMLFKIKI